MSGFRRFFWRGLGIILPTVLTIWLLVVAYNFIDQNVAQKINRLIKWTMIELTPYPKVSLIDRTIQLDELKEEADSQAYKTYAALREEEARDRWLEHYAREQKLDKWWKEYWYVSNFTGLVVAVVLIYILGAFLGSYLGRRIMARIERFIERLPLVRKVYPAVKQVTDFFVAQDKPAVAQFNRVVAVQYPRKGIWSVGLLTGATMRQIQQNAAIECVTIFIPSSPTPFTGYVISVPREDVIDLDVNIEEALKFVISGGVLVPPGQEIKGAVTGTPQLPPGEAT